MDEKRVREDLVELLRGGSAHTELARALEGVSPRARAARPGPSVRSIWDELEHMRLAQEDILHYTLDPEWTSPPWPEGYWPPEGAAVTDAEWEASVAAFREGLDGVVRLVEDTSVDLTAPIPHGEGRSYLREVLLVADHNAYHLGQIVQLRKLLGDWPA